MSTTGKPRRAVVVVAAISALACLTFRAPNPAPDPQQPRTRPASVSINAGRGPATGQATLASDDGDDPEPPVMSRGQAERLLRAVGPGLVTITVGLARGGTKAGTGIVLCPSGRVLTNDHVVAGAVSMTVHDLGTDLDYTARIVGADPSRDIAVLRLLGATGLSTAHLGGKVEVGDVVASIGNAYGLGELSAGAGRVVALHRAIASTTGRSRPLTGLIEARNGVEPGESGGPMVTTRGRVIGVTVATGLTATGDPNGDGYAIPIGTALATARRILASHSEVR